mgnify:CR=1 FL=1
MKGNVPTKGLISLIPLTSSSSEKAFQADTIRSTKASLVNLVSGLEFCFKMYLRTILGALDLHIGVSTGYRSFLRWPDLDNIVVCLVKQWCSGRNGTRSDNQESLYCAEHLTGYSANFIQRLTIR